MSEENPSGKKKIKIRQALWNDIRQGGFKRIFRQDLKDIYQFYLDQETKERLSRMGRVKRWLHQAYWILRSLIFKLSAVRRILLVLSILLFLFSPISIDGDVQIVIRLRFLGFVILLVVLMLELKDKLLAQDELAIGRAVQSALMPKDNPDLPGWECWLFTRSANEVGGDLVDYLFLDDTRLGLALGDVAGKGLGAALLTAKLQSTIRAIVTHFSSLSEIGSELNRIFCRDGLPQRFVSLVYLETEAESDHIRFLNAGHLPPILVHRGKTKEMDQGGPALGIMPKTTFTEQSIRLEKDDVLVIYSDGITEARNEAGEFFGEKRLLNILRNSQGLPASSLGNRLLYEVQSFVGEARPSDDLSLILLKYTG
jgi:hypothetical protein